MSKFTVKMRDCRTHLRTTNPIFEQKDPQYAGHPQQTVKHKNVWRTVVFQLVAFFFSLTPCFIPVGFVSSLSCLLFLFLLSLGKLSPGSYPLLPFNVISPSFPS